eukprot:CAMPEP_0206307756 /NCGR_PEP_ID=MMETSP0106_2-20121207/11499_1 /ASSEMBLY_ACC=CAM_ASM_000206 /TAXON_ID=81532 /ORGANISM="Acanthoeca-like sp., Strain 10tr" /LENGTH=48 /DNA_ID= /DNA_START= /DNA_END= /DNA_ORIENTATION=
MCVRKCEAILPHGSHDEVAVLPELLMCVQQYGAILLHGSQDEVAVLPK